MWQVRRKWLPHREGIGVRARFRRVIRKLPSQDRPTAPAGKPTTPVAERRTRWYDHLDAGGCVDFDELAILVVVIVLALLVIFVFPPLVLIGVDLIWAGFIFLFTAIGRLVFGRPWSVVAATAEGERREWKVKGFRGAGQLRDALQAEFDAGLDPRPDNLGE